MGSTFGGFFCFFSVEVDGIVGWRARRVFSFKRLGGVVRRRFRIFY